MKGSTAYRRATPVLLCLLAHAVLVTVTHHHKLRGESPARPRVLLESSTTPVPGGWGASQSDSGCLSCSLQRNFVSDLHPFRIAVLLPSAEQWQPAPSLAPSIERCLCICNRAPPINVPVV